MALTLSQPKLRPVEAHRAPGGDAGQFIIQDPTGLAEAALTVSEPALFILSLLDGEHDRETVAAKFTRRYAAPLKPETLDSLIENLDRSRFLHGPSFERHYAELQEAYRSAPSRPSVYAGQLGTAGEVNKLLAEMIPPVNGTPNRDHRICGIVAPHLDYPRGWPCYAEAYGVLRGRTCPDRCVILGTNHFGSSHTVVATGQAFETPLGLTEVDIDFLHAVEARCEFDLRENEIDHRREHSIELQVLCLQHLYGAGSFKIVPFLCPDPCGPTGTAPFDGHGVDLREFALALRDVVTRFGGDTLLVAGADLSHVGVEFGDREPLDDAFLSTVETRDQEGLDQLVRASPDRFVQALLMDDNATRVCSAGCLYVLATALHDCRPGLLRYHQARTDSAQICVTCAAMTYAR